MHRAALAAVAGVVLATTTACGSHKLRVVIARVNYKVPTCTVKVSLADTAGHSTRTAVERAALGANGVTSVIYVSKRVSFAVLRKKYPDMVRGLTSNPLPNAYLVTFDDSADAAAGAARLGRIPMVVKTAVSSDCP